jgi:hypothetical protein
MRRPMRVRDVAVEEVVDERLFDQLVDDVELMIAAAARSSRRRPAAAILCAV